MNIRYLFIVLLGTLTLTSCTLGQQANPQPPVAQPTQPALPTQIILNEQGSNVPPQNGNSQDLQGTEVVVDQVTPMKIEYEKVALVGTIQSLGELRCPCFKLQAQDGKEYTVTYSMFPDQTMKNVDVSMFKNGQTVSIQGLKEKNSQSPEITVLLEKIVLVQ